MSSVISCSDSEVVLDESSNCCIGDTYTFCDTQIHKIPSQTQKIRNLRLLAKASIRLDRFHLRKLRHPSLDIRRPTIMTKNIEKVKKMIKICSKVICEKDLKQSDIDNNQLAVKLGHSLTNKYQQNGYFDIICMMLNHNLPHEKYFTKTHKHHHIHHKHHHKHHHKNH